MGSAVLVNHKEPSPILNDGTTLLNLVSPCKRWGKRGRNAYLLDKSDLGFFKVSEGSWPNNFR